MGCLFAVVGGLFPRFALLLYWLARPLVVNAAFSTFIIPCLGFVFLPFTTLMYVLLWSSGGGIQGFDWVWLILAAVIDIVGAGSTGYANRNRIPAGYPGSTSPTSY
jgi:hypothetical protein